MRIRLLSIISASSTLLFSQAVLPVIGVSTASAATVTAPGCSATVSNSNTAVLTRVDDQCVLTFTSGTNAWTVPSDTNSVRVLVVGGGGGGGQNGGGGGGGGQVVHNASFSVTSNSSISVMVGAAGASPGPSNWNDAGGLGGTSSFSTISALGGGGGGSRGSNPHAVNGQPGYTGGGGGGYQTVGGVGSSGADGGNGHEAGCDATGGGGGGASGASGTAGAYRDGGDGGDGVASDISGTTRYYGGGGAGGGTCDNSQGQTWSGTPGRGGASASQSASSNTGGGGGGGGAVGWSFYGGDGGSGVVIVSWPGLALPPSSSVSPSFTGSAEFGSVLTGAIGTWTQSPTSYSYRWMRSSSPSGSFTAISGATGLTYTLSDDDIDMYIKFEVRASNSAGFEVDTSVASAKVTNLPISVSPILGSASSTSDGFVFNITNLNSLTSYTLTLSTSSGTASRSSDVVTVSGLSGGNSATVTVTSSRSGYRNTSATITGSAIALATNTSSVNTENNSTGATTTVTNAQRTPSSTTPVSSTASTTSTTSTTTTTTTVPPAPAAEPGEASVAVDGVDVNALVTRSNNQLVIEAGSLSATISGRTADGAQALLDSDGNIRLEEGDSLVFEASGFDANSALEVWIFSTPTKLGSVSVSANGSTSGVFAIPTGIDDGKHRMVLSGINPNESKAVFAVGIIVGGDGGIGTVGTILIASPLVLAMLAALVIPARRRRQKVIIA